MEHINVAVRIRPDNEAHAWAIEEPNHIYLASDRHPKKPSKTAFVFDQCFLQDATNEDVYVNNVQNIVLSSLKGMNGTVFAYGQTGSGKTYTMLGDESPSTVIHERSGILLQSLSEIFTQIDKDQDKTYFMHCSYIEIYNEQIFDLLKPSQKLGETLSINEDARKEFYIRGVTEESVSSIDETLDVLRRGEMNRHYAQTYMNHNSSRSHAIFRLNVKSITNNFIRNYRRSVVRAPNVNNEELYNVLFREEPATERIDGALITESMLNFVDLAGSEKVSAHSSIPISVEDSDQEQLLEQNFRQRERMREGQYINKSLFFLTQVIFLKAEDKGHIPYRNSSLTKILKSSLGGNSRTLIILCVEQSISTLRFGANAKKIQNKVKANVRSHNDDEAIKIIISEYEKKIRDLEKIRLDDKQTLDFLYQQIKSLMTEKDKLNERINQLNKSSFKEIFNQREIIFQTAHSTLMDPTIHINNAGLLFNFDTQWKSKPEPEKHDCNGKLALQSLRISKNAQNRTIEQINILLRNFHSIEKFIEESLRENLALSQTAGLYEEIVRDLFAEQDTIRDSITQLKKNLDLYETLTNVSSLSDDFIEKHINRLGELQDKMKQELWRRKVLGKCLTGEQQLCRIYNLYRVLSQYVLNPTKQTMNLKDQYPVLSLPVMQELFKPHKSVVSDSTFDFINNIDITSKLELIRNGASQLNNISEEFVETTLKQVNNLFFRGFVHPTAETPNVSTKQQNKENCCTPPQECNPKPSNRQMDSIPPLAEVINTGTNTTATQAADQQTTTKPDEVFGSPLTNLQQARQHKYSSKQSNQGEVRSEQIRNQDLNRSTNAQAAPPRLRTMTEHIETPNNLRTKSTTSQRSHQERSLVQHKSLQTSGKYCSLQSQSKKTPQKEIHKTNQSKSKHKSPTFKNNYNSIPDYHTFSQKIRREQAKCMQFLHDSNDLEGFDHQDLDMNNFLFSSGQSFVL